MKRDGLGKRVLSPPGARGRTRTGMGLPPRDFKSLASTDFATRADDRNQCLARGSVNSSRFTGVAVLRPFRAAGLHQGAAVYTVTDWSESRALAVRAQAGPGAGHGSRERMPVRKCRTLRISRAGERTAEAPGAVGRGRAGGERGRCFAPKDRIPRHHPFGPPGPAPPFEVYRFCRPGEAGGALCRIRALAVDQNRPQINTERCLWRYADKLARLGLTANLPGQ